MNYKILTILILSGLLLILSCQSDPIVGLNNLNGDNLKHTNLKSKAEWVLNSKKIKTRAVLALVLGLLFLYFI